MSLIHGADMKKMRVLLTLSALTLSACSLLSTDEVRYPAPDFFVQFESGGSVLNNSYQLTQRLAAGFDRFAEPPLVVVVGSGKTEEDYTLAVSRLYAIADVGVHADYRVLVQPLEREEQRDRVGIYLVPSWGEFERRYMLAGDYSQVPGSGGVYRASDKRLFLATPTNRVIHPTGSEPAEQLDSLLNELGWSLHADGDALPRGKLIGHIQVVTIEPVATSGEITKLLGQIGHQVLPGCQYSVLPETRQVTICGNYRN